MAEQFESLSTELISFIEQQPIFFVGSAAAEGRVNVSPKGQDSLRVLSPNKILWLNLTGSGNETAAHLLACNRITLMWCAFDGPPRILRVYGRAEMVHPQHSDWYTFEQMLPASLGARQYCLVDVDMVQTSCGYAVPTMEFVDHRVALTKWSEKRGQEGIEKYWRDKNTRSIDGFETGIDTGGTSSGDDGAVQEVSNSNG